MLELSGEEEGDDDLMDSALDEENCDKAKNGMGYIPKFQEPLEKEW
jgi:hypothetical protein